jgi:nucleotide sugar dehydrogenase
MNAPRRKPAETSIAPDGTVYPLPSTRDTRSSFAEIAATAKRHRDAGGQVVVVQGLGFVGSAVAAVVASANQGDGRPLHYVIGVDLERPETYWKVATINAGLPPVASTDQDLARLTRQAVEERGNLRATTCEDAYSLADVIIVDIHLDAQNVGTTPFDITVGLDAFEAAIRTVGRRMRRDALVLVETTVPVGTCEHVVLPILRQERRLRGIDEPVLLASAYERVMPGPNYVSSIRAYPRTFAGVDRRSADKARKFLSTCVSGGKAALWELDDPTSSELGKLLENSYRSMNIAFIHEWALLAEKIGVNLFAVVDSIRVRKGTHDNMRYPGFGVGGYCLTKDSLLAQWGVTNLLGSDATLAMTLDALRTNQLMPLHTLELAKELLGGDLHKKRITVCGVSYIADVADTRNSPTGTLVEGLLAEGAEVRVHDPTLRAWPEKPAIPIVQNLAEALAGVDGVVLAVPHEAYRALPGDALTAHVGSPAFAVDAQNVLSDRTAGVLRAAGWRLLGVGKGHWRRQGLHEPS